MRASSYRYLEQISSKPLDTPKLISLIVGICQAQRDNIECLTTFILKNFEIRHIFGSERP